MGMTRFHYRTLVSNRRTLASTIFGKRKPSSAEKIIDAKWTSTWVGYRLRLNQSLTLLFSLMYLPGSSSLISRVHFEILLLAGTDYQLKCLSKNGLFINSKYVRAAGASILPKQYDPRRHLPIPSQLHSRLDVYFGFPVQISVFHFHRRPLRLEAVHSPCPPKPYKQVYPHRRHSHQISPVHQPVPPFRFTLFRISFFSNHTSK